MEIRYANVVLRDMEERDIEDYVRWFTVERDWEDWDAPWEKEDTDEATQRSEWTAYYVSVKGLPADVRRWRFEIDCDGRHVGWVSSYLIDEQCEWISSKDVREGKKVHTAIGIDICEPDVRGKGIGTKTLHALMAYYFDNGEDVLYTQTWSGNVRMLCCAAKLGFTVCDREKGIREVRGKRYDGLTLCVRKDYFALDGTALFHHLHPDFFAQAHIRCLPRDSICEEQLLDLRTYVPTADISCPANITFGWYKGDIAALHEAVASVDAEWVPLFQADSRVYCAFDGERVVSFCLADDFGEFRGMRVGGPGCVGTTPAYRRQGIGLKMVANVTALLKAEGYALGYIHYTQVGAWYARLGYRTIVRWNAAGVI